MMVAVQAFIIILLYFFGRTRMLTLFAAIPDTIWRFALKLCSRLYSIFKSFEPTHVSTFFISSAKNAIILEKMKYKIKKTLILLCTTTFL
jgi:hypothetical protein